ncbi:MAG: gliding motility-associated C-terminal domain-containing protein [Bacteroidota bacterium]
MHYTWTLKTKLVLFFLLASFRFILAQPLSDDCDGLIDLGQAPVCTGEVYTNVDATLSEVFTDPSFNFPTCWSFINHDVWAVFTVPADGSIVDFVITINGVSNGPNNNSILQPQLALYRGSCQQDGLAELFCASAVAGSNDIQLVAEGLTPGLSYFLRIDDEVNTASPNWGDFEICIEELVLDVEIISSSMTLCAGQPLNLQANINGDFDNINWTPANLFLDPNVENPVLSGSGTLFQTTTFSVEVMSGSLSDTDEITIQVSNPQVAINQTTDATCTGICNGSATATVTGSISTEDALAYAWSNGATTATVTDLCGGDYTVTVTDEAGCSTTTSVTINESIFSVSAIATINPCSSELTGSATALILSGGSEPFTYLWSNGETSTSIENLAAGIYEVTVTDGNGCNTSASIEINITPIYTPTITTSAEAICPGETVTLTAPTPSNSTSLVWSTGETTPSITVTPTETTTYSLSSSTISQNIIINGDFEEGESGFTTQYLPGPGGVWGLLSDEGTYAVNVNSANVHNNFPSCLDFSGSGNMLIVNGSADADAQIWCQTVTVAPNTDYLFATWGMTVISENPAILQFSIGDELLGTPFTLSPIQCEWNSFNESWNSGNNTTTEICIVNQNLQQSGNDFALDNMSLTPICTGFDEISITMSELEANVLSQTNVSCQGVPGSALVEATSNLEPLIYRWDNGETTAQAGQLDAGVHQVTVSNSIGCENILSVAIQADPQISIDELIVNGLSCGEVVDGESLINAASITIGSSNATLPAVYSINGVDFQQDNTFEGLEAGTYELTLEDADGCLATISAIIEPLLLPLSPNLTMSADDLCNTDESIEIGIANAEDYTSFLWSTEETDDFVLVSEGGVISVTAFDENNCAATDSLEVIDCAKYEIPNVFSPNGDGTNDIFKVYHTGNGFEFNSLKVFNRWGQLVHETNINEPWDGMVNGEPAPSDVFIYRAVVTLNGETQEERGSVTLIR